MLSEISRKSIVNIAESRQIFPLRENTLRHVVEGDGRYPRAMTPSEEGKFRISSNNVVTDIDEVVLCDTVWKQFLTKLCNCMWSSLIMYLTISEVIKILHWKLKSSVKFTNLTLCKNGMFLMLMKLYFYNIPCASFWSIICFPFKQFINGWIIELNLCDWIIPTKANTTCNIGQVAYKTLTKFISQKQVVMPAIINLTWQCCCVMSHALPEIP